MGVYSSIDELLHDSMEESENEYNEMDFDKKYLTGLDSEEEKLGAEDFRSESDTNNNELMSVEKNIDFDVISEEESHNSDYESKAKHNQKDEVVPVTTNISKMNEDMNVANKQPSQVPPTPRPTRWDVPPPGLSVKLGKHPFQLPPIYHVAQISVPRRVADGERRALLQEDERCEWNNCQPWASVLYCQGEQWWGGGGYEDYS